MWLWRGLAGFVAAGFALLAFAPSGRCVGATRTLAVADFAVRAGVAREAEYRWLASAVPELLQAKMQLFSGARVAERLRIPFPSLELSPERAGRIVADVLLLGSVEVPPVGAGGETMIRVRVRAVETETGRIISEATASCTTKLAGLLAATEEVAKPIADGLGLTYSPSQIAYAEPASIDTLRFYLDGLDQLAGGRPREAIDSFQKALDGNAGVYYAAAHRSQGEAYRALSGSAGGAEARAVNEEYLKKFKEDALTASGALFDLGSALEANGLWREAIGVYEDYVKVVGTEGETVRWTFDPRASVMKHATIPDPAMAEGGRIHLLVCAGQPSADPRWVILDSKTGSLIGQFKLFDLLGLTPKEAWVQRIFGADDGVIYLYGYGVTGLPGTVPASQIRRCNPWAAAIDVSGRVLWKAAIGAGEQWVESDAVAFKGRLAIELGRLETVILSSADGSVLRRYNPREATYDPATDTLHRKTVVGDDPFMAADYPTGTPGLTVSLLGTWGLFRDGQRILDLANRSPLARPLRMAAGGWLAFGEYAGIKLVAVNPDDLSLLDLYGELRVPATLVGQDKDYVVFALENDPKGGVIDQRYGVESTMKGTAINVVSKASRTVVGKTFLTQQQWIAADGHDLIVFSGGAVTRQELLPRGNVVVTPRWEAHFGIASCLLELNDVAGSDKHMALFEGLVSGDPRASLLRMKRAARLGKPLESARFALAALASGGVSDTAARRCLETIRAARPEVRDIVLTPVKSRLMVRGMAGPGLLTCTPSGGQENRLHLVVDTVGKTTRLVPTPELAPNVVGGGLTSLWYRGRNVYYSRESGDLQLFRVDLLSGRHVAGEKLKYGGGRFFPGLPYWVRPSLPSSKKRRLLKFDPESLQVVKDLEFDVGVGYWSDLRPVYVGNPSVFADEDRHSCDRPSSSLVVIDPDDGREVARLLVGLNRERVVSVAADGDRVIVGVNGGDVLAYADGREGFWYRVESFPIGPGGRRWTYRAEGRLTAPLAIDGGRAAFSAFEGRFPAPREKIAAPEKLLDACNGKGMSAGPVVYEGPEVNASRITLDLGDGSRMTAEPAAPESGDHVSGGGAVRREFHAFCNFCVEDLPVRQEGARGILPGMSLSRGRFPGDDAMWDEGVVRLPLEFTPWSVGEDFKVIVDGFRKYSVEPETEAQLLWQGTVYEPVGGGVILIKDLASGRGLDPVGSVLALPR